MQRTLTPGGHGVIGGHDPVVVEEVLSVVVSTRPGRILHGIDEVGTHLYKRHRIDN